MLLIRSTFCVIVIVIGQAEDGWVNQGSTYLDKPQRCILSPRWNGYSPDHACKHKNLWEVTAPSKGHHQCYSNRRWPGQACPAQKQEERGDGTGGR